MEENETLETPQTTAPPATRGEDAAPETITPPPVAPAAPVVPEGYVKAEDVETERTARTAAEEARTAAETARAEAETRAVAAEARVRAADIRAQAQALNFNDPADAERFIGADVEDIGAALADVLKTKPYLAKSEAPEPPPVTPTSPTNPARSTQLTVEAIKNMTPAQCAANWDAVKLVLQTA